MTTCGWCGKELPADARGCGCKWRTQGFERLCVGCKKPMPPKANKCPECNRVQFSTTEFLHVRCGNCKGKDSVLWEIDDLFAALNCPLIFQTKKFVKMRWFKDDVSGAKAYIKYFQPTKKGATVETVRRSLTASDEHPWHFPTTQNVIWFLNNFPCNKCGGKNWKHDLMENVVSGAKKATRLAKPYAIPITLSVWAFFVSAIAVLSQLTRSVWDFFAVSPKQVEDAEDGGQQNNQRRTGENRRRKGGRR